MRLFQREQQPTRSLEEMFTPREEVLENSESEKESVEIENTETAMIFTLSEDEKESKPFNALDCFGWNENKTEKWLIKCANVWYAIISLIWFLFGIVSFAPVIFISNKVNVIFNHKKRALLCSIAMYLVFIALLVIFLIMR